MNQPQPATVGPHSLHIVIVSWNAGALLRECMASIAPAAEAMDGEVQVVIVDNASTDGSLAEIEPLGLPVRVIRNQQNRGFACACNQGARSANSEYVLFLNPDTKLTSTSLSAPVDFLSRPDNAHIGILGIQMIGSAGEISRSCSRFPTPWRLLTRAIGLDVLFPSIFPGIAMREWDHNADREVDQVIGAYFLTRRRLFQELGGFDQRFFVYFEEVDFCLRARASGWRTYFLAGVQAFHRGGGSSEQVLAQRLFYSLRSRVAYSRKHFSRAGAIAVVLATLFLEPVTRMTLAVLRGSRQESAETLSAYLLLWRNLLLPGHST